MLRKWIEAMRLRTLPVSIAGVITGTALAIRQGGFSPAPALLCLVFAVTAQIASNFGNEYYDFKKGMHLPAALCCFMADGGFCLQVSVS